MTSNLRLNQTKKSLNFILNITTASRDQPHPVLFRNRLGQNAQYIYRKQTVFLSQVLTVATKVDRARPIVFFFVLALAFAQLNLLLYEPGALSEIKPF